MDIANTTQSNNNTANVSSSISGNVNSAEEMSTMFLELLVAQISNQNPLQPMDGTEYVSQLAEFSNVESLQSIKNNTSASLDNSSSMLVLEATNLVGETVTVPADVVALEKEGKVSGLVNLSTPADSVTVQLYDSNGQLVEEKQLAYSGVGSLNFEFDEQDAGGYSINAFSTTNGVSQRLTPWLNGEVERVSVGSSSDDILLQVDGLGNFALTDINQVA
ncbi:LfgD [Pseudoalteromonas sp. CO302Y]|jgi:flagellar basal-body rod modification protein FlgD|uniref:flagellar hook assembly protein FlgD n=1 Tax=unclassified Pseudoalteromonas TaxID=194690 RepID=UPI0010233DCB|nr:LfgD [Pseudoalteromonas sp. CO302Y]RZG08484.1 LfgD [Pseudoalteromonas sp. CO133X]